jgi:hypothetical protein
MDHQVPREMLGESSVFEVAERLLDLRNATVIFRNNAVKNGDSREEKKAAATCFGAASLRFDAVSNADG